MHPYLLQQFLSCGDRLKASQHESGSLLCFDEAVTGFRCIP